MNELDKAFQEAMKKYQFTAYSGRIYMDMKTMFTEGYNHAHEEMGLWERPSEQDFGVIEKDQDLGQTPKQLELF